MRKNLRRKEPYSLQAIDKRKGSWFWKYIGRPRFNLRLCNNVKRSWNSGEMVPKMCDYQTMISSFVLTRSRLNSRTRFLTSNWSTLSLFATQFSYFFLQTYSRHSLWRIITHWLIKGSFYPVIFILRNYCLQHADADFPEVMPSLFCATYIISNYPPTSFQFTSSHALVNKRNKGYSPIRLCSYQIWCFARSSEFPRSSRNKERFGRVAHGRFSATQMDTIMLMQKEKLHHVLKPITCIYSHCIGSTTVSHFKRNVVSDIAHILETLSNKWHRRRKLIP